MVRNSADIKRRTRLNNTYLIRVALRKYFCLPCMSCLYMRMIRTHSNHPLLKFQAKFPYEWQPKIVSCAMARVGGFLLAAVPGEFTTMSGRRLRHEVLKASRGSGRRVVIAGLSNIYSDYVATPEEYQVG